MDRKKLVLLLGALIIAIGTAFAARSMFAEGAAPEVLAAPEPDGPKVLVANRGLPAGTIITADALGYQQWPEELVKDAYFLDGESDVNQLIGTVVRFPVTAGEPLTQGSLVSPGDRGFLAAALAPGMRAVTVPVSARTGVAGFVFPGDRVDVVLTQQYRSEVTDLEYEGSETILKNVRVLATDQSTETVTNEEGKTVVRAFRTVTVEVTPEIAEQVGLAQTMGTLSLSLRPLADSQAELERAIARGDVNIPDGASPEEEERILRAARSGPVSGSKSYESSFGLSQFRRSIQVKDEAIINRRIKAQEQGYSGSAAKSGIVAINPGPTVRVTRGKDTREVPVNTGSSSTNSQLVR
ncbi:Flp pilus assembly protein CpaB [Erythrobacter insulae]|uniref:Flp pilus assembly protein CpaB n=1 Tax=Erythrobacter insulae TaxID=2584124 RepID=A0A547P9E9_9SPHN|nr:Flp pilus assembly protein CpaB [Erythrobacter insulae]TRD10756.1 Flp pilus assembly protein CpaB [Erythrobacter insulae]